MNYLTLDLLHRVFKRDLKVENKSTNSKLKNASLLKQLFGVKSDVKNAKRLGVKCQKCMAQGVKIALVKSVAETAET